MSKTLEVQVRQVGPSTSEGQARNHKVLVDRPEAKGGSDKGPLGGELLVLSLGGCFMSTLLAAVRAREAAVSNVRIDVQATVESSPDRISSMHLKVSADYDDRDLMEKLITVASNGCLVTNTLKQGMSISVELAD